MRREYLTDARASTALLDVAHMSNQTSFGLIGHSKYFSDADWLMVEEYLQSRARGFGELTDVVNFLGDVAPCRSCTCFTNWDTTFLDGGQPSPVVSECLANDREPCRKPSDAEQTARISLSSARLARRPGAFHS